MPNSSDTTKETAIEQIEACAAENPCEAAWETSYMFAAEKQYELAVFQSLQGVVFGALQYASADRTADLQYDIADRQMKISEEEYERYKEIYRPCEDALAEEICAMDCPQVDYDLYADRASRDVTREYSLAREKSQRTRLRYCMADHLTNHYNLDRSEALAKIAIRDAAYRTAEKRNDFLDEKRWERRRQMFTLGRSIQTGQINAFQGAIAPATEALQGSQDAFKSLLGTLSGAVGSVANAYYAPQINAPSVFGVDQNSNFNTAWGSYQNGFTGGGGGKPSSNTTF
jgi:hypothetical protein